jgi:hypothetical protein
LDCHSALVELGKAKARVVINTLATAPSLQLGAAPFHAAFRRAARKMVAAIAERRIVTGARWHAPRKLFMSGEDSDLNIIDGVGFTPPKVGFA